MHVNFPELPGYYVKHKTDIYNLISDFQILIISSKRYIMKNMIDKNIKQQIKM